MPFIVLPGRIIASVRALTRHDATFPSKERGPLVNDQRPQKAFTKVPANYEQLSEEDRKQWIKEASAAIVSSLKKRESKPKQV